MSNPTRFLSRREALMAKGACLAVATVPGRGLAATTQTACAADTACAPAAPYWHNATATELTSLIGDRFRFTSKEHGTVALKLVALEANPSGPARPGDLPRRDGVTALFAGPDMGPLVAAGDGIYDIAHPRMGRSTALYVTAPPRQDGTAYIELVLN